MEIVLKIAGFLLFAKLFIFWLWLWQLKEYHIGRFFAHFETQAFRKIASSFWRQRFPIFTAKIFIIAALGLFAAAFAAALSFFLILFLIIFAPIISSLWVLLFQPFAVLVRKQLLLNARKKREQFKNLTVVGITGSYGKTSTKEFLSFILSKKFRVLKTAEHRNSEVGIAKTILEDLHENHQIFICEIGAYGKGGVRLLADMAKPSIAILTGANEQHLATFGSIENLLSAEGGEELVKALPREGKVIANADSELLFQRKTQLEQSNLSVQQFVWCSAKTRANVWAEQVVAGKDSLSFVAHVGEEKVQLKVNLVGGYNVENLLLAIGTAKELGMSLKEIADAVFGIPQELGAMKLQKIASGLNVVESTYSANPNGVIAALEYLKVWQDNPSTGLRVKKIVVMPCLIELGSASREVHKKIGAKIAEVCDLAIITTKDRFEEIQEAAFAKVSAGQRAIEVVCIENPLEIIEKIKSIVSFDDIVLLEGRGPIKMRDL